MYIYEGHMGGIYFSEDEVEDTYCEQCGDSDWLLCSVRTLEDAWLSLKGETDIGGNGGYSLPYIVSALLSEFVEEKDDEDKEIFKRLEQSYYNLGEITFTEEELLGLMNKYIQKEQEEREGDEY